MCSSSLQAFLLGVVVVGVKTSFLIQSIFSLFHVAINISLHKTILLRFPPLIKLTTHGITVILLQVALSTINPKPSHHHLLSVCDVLFENLLSSRKFSWNIADLMLNNQSINQSTGIVFIGSERLYNYYTNYRLNMIL
jgi:hypothetical protein